MQLTYWAALVAGLLSFLSPCVLPLVPPYLGFLAGATMDEMRDGAAGRHDLRLRLALVAAAFVAGFATVFVALGATASVIGQLVARYSNVLATVSGVLILIMGLHFLGLFRLGLLYREARFSSSGVKAGPLGAYVMGLAFAFGWTPCIGPILAAILAVAGASETVGEGALLLAVYAAGLGIPFFAAGVFAPLVLGWTARLRRHMDVVEKLMGLVLVATGLMFLTGTLSTVSFLLLDWFPSLARLG